MYGHNLERKILNKILYEVDSSDGYRGIFKIKDEYYIFYPNSLIM
jgi:hypothetical protein